MEVSMMKKIRWAVAYCLLAVPFLAQAQESVPPVETATPAVQETSRSVLVMIPERVDVEWFWYHYGVQDEMNVQTAVEKGLLRAGIELADARSTEAFPDGLSMEELLTPAQALDIAQSLGAGYLVLGKGIASNGGSSQAYGVPVHRSNAQINARILRVADGKTLDVLDVNLTEGDQSDRAAARKALKTGGKNLARQIRAVIQKDMESTPAP